MTGNLIKKPMLLASLLALATGPGSHAADRGRYQKQVATMTCGAATYTLTSACIKSGDPMSLNECKPQTLVIDNAGAKRSTILPELPNEYAARIRASRGGLEDLFVVAWACSNASAGPIATLHYSIGGGSAEYSEAWSYYDKAGDLILNDRKLTLDEVRAVERSLERVPSIMPELPLVHVGIEASAKENVVYFRNTGDAISAAPNRLVSENEKLHKTHLHITVRNSELGH